jgi:long-subunit acyl-CoA synthetase (AMP-forming)
MYYGVSVYYAESMETIADNIREVKPAMFASVPRLLEKVYDKILAKGNELTGNSVEGILVTGQRVSGKLTYIARAADAVSRSYRIEVELDSIDLELLMLVDQLHEN